MKRILIIIYLTIVSASLMAQDDAVIESGMMDSVTVPGVRGLVSQEARDLFNSLLPQQDTLLGKKPVYKDTFGKRISFHFNMLEWALTLPNIGIEFDLNKSVKNNRSVLVYGKINPKLKHNYNPQTVFNEMGARVEFRKYWRTGGVGMVYDNEYQRIRLKRPKQYTREKQEIDGEDTTVVVEKYYQTHADSILAEQYTGDPNRGWLYNRYHQFRRNVTSGRTLRHPRDWRAYYLGAYAAIDKWNICFNKQGKQGVGASLGMSLGWSIPMLTRKFPNEGGLDLELGALIGPRVLKYDAYKYVTESACYEYDAAKSKPTWHISMNPIQELRLSFVYRFRSISRKVSHILIDEYGEKWVKPFEDRKTAMKDSLENKEREEIRVAEETKIQNRKMADSTSYANWWHERRLRNALLINPDTVFTALDDTLHKKLILGIDLKNKDDVKRMEREQKKQQDEAKKREKEEQKAAKAAQKEKPKKKDDSDDKAEANEAEEQKTDEVKPAENENSTKEPEMTTEESEPENSEQ